MNEPILGWHRLEGQSGHDAGRQLLAELYRKAFGAALPEIAVTPRGKPYFLNGSCHFSISHTRSHVFCILSPVPVGIDAEEADRKVDLRLADRILSPGEKIRYNRAADPARTLLTFWVMKEAAAKCSGEGLRGYPCHTDFSPDDPRVREIDGCLVAIFT